MSKFSALLSHYHTLHHLDTQRIYFSQCFLPYTALIFHSKCTLKCRLQFVSIWTSVKFCRLVMGEWLDYENPLFSSNLLCSGLCKPIIPFSIVLLIWRTFCHFNQIKIVICKVYQFGRVWNLLFGTEVTVKIHLLFPKWQILDSSKLKEFADNNSEFDENSRKFSNRVENIVGKVEIAYYKQLPFPTLFLKDLCCRHVKTWACLGKG